MDIPGPIVPLGQDDLSCHLNLESAFRICGEIRALGRRLDRVTRRKTIRQIRRCALCQANGYPSPFIHFGRHSALVAEYARLAAQVNAMQAGLARTFTARHFLLTAYTAQARAFNRVTQERFVPAYHNGEVQAFAWLAFPESTPAAAYRREQLIQDTRALIVPTESASGTPPLRLLKEPIP